MDPVIVHGGRGHIHPRLAKRKGPAEAGPSMPAGRVRPAKQDHIVSIARSLVSGRKNSATTKLIAAMMIGYHRPE